MPANDAGAAEDALADAAEALADAAEALADAAEALADAAEALVDAADALALPDAAAELLAEPPPHATRPRQHTHNMVAHSIARYFFMESLSLGFPPRANNTMNGTCEGAG